MSDRFSTPSTPDDVPHASSSSAPFRHFPKQALAAIEYPGTVSHPSDLLKVINQDDINECFNAPISEPRSLELSYRKNDRSGVPVRGTRVPSQKLLLKIVKRRRKMGIAERGKGKGTEAEAKEGVFTAEIVGPITQTVRFRCQSVPKRTAL